MVGFLRKFFIISFLAFFLLPNVSLALTSEYPRKANYFLKWDLTETEAKELAKWDLVILDMEIQSRQPGLIRKMREWNPHITILAYITSQEIVSDASSSYSKMRRKLAEKIGDSWYLRNSSGSRITWWPGTYLLNVTSDSPVVNGKMFNKYLAEFVSNEILSIGLWDGVFYDNCWDNITYFVGADVDTDINGQANSDADAKWREGMKFLYNETRRLTQGKYIIIGNGTTREYRDELNGKMMENFIESAWSPTMNTYAYNFGTKQTPQVTIINANTSNGGNNKNFQHLRFTFASALLENGFYSFDYGDKDHGQTWWYDEYGINLGGPMGGSLSRNSYTTYKPDVWRRDFNNGLALVNSTGEKQRVTLGGEYEKIHGTQDKTINDGSIVTETDINSFDGLVLLKTFATLQDTIFRNGSFVRFFRPDGSRVRNGFFVFESTYKGGDKVAHIDLDGNGQKELIVVSGSKITIWRDDGLLYMRDYPYTASYKGDLKVAVGDLNNDTRLEVYVSPSNGYPAPIKIYTRHGRQMKADWFPMGEKYSGGYSIAVRTVGGDKRNQLIIGAGVGQKPMVSVYDDKYNLIKQWLSFESGFTGGVNVAAGDVDGNGSDEVIVGAGPGKKPEIRVFDIDGKLLNKFIAYDSFNTPGIEVMAVDVDYDGKDDILGMGNGF